MMGNGTVGMNTMVHLLVIYYLNTIVEGSKKETYLVQIILFVKIRINYGKKVI